MAIDAIRTKLVTILGGVSGIQKVFKDDPDVQPTEPDLPCYVLSMRQPMVNVAARTNSNVGYDWYFNLTFLLKEGGLGKLDENLSELEDFIKLTIDALGANVTGGGAWVAWNKDDGTLSITGGLLTRENAAAESNKYWGFTADLNIYELVETTFSAGS